MNLRTVIGWAVLGVCVQANVGSAETPEPSAADDARPAFLAAASSEVPGTALAYAGGEGGPFAAPPGATLRVRRYYKTPPPPPPPRAPREPQGWMQARGGFYDGDNATGDDWTIGLKTVAQVAPAFRIGGTVDLQQRTNSNVTIYTDTYSPGGQLVRSAATVPAVESNLVPLMAVAEMVFPVTGVQPYVGFAGGWEFLDVDLYDPLSGWVYNADYDGVGWQAYVGADFAVAPRVRLTAELFHNGSTVDRHVFDPYTGASYDENIDVDGNGGRFGLSFAF